MFNNTMDLNLLKYFSQIVEAKSLSEAARRSDMSRANISIKLKQLENNLNVQLFRRSTRNIELTQAGQILYEKSLKIFQEVDDINNKLNEINSVMKGYIRVRVPLGIGQKYFSDFFIDFLKEYPDIDLKITYNDSLDDLIESEIDFAVKITNEPNEKYVAQKVCPINWVMCAAPSYLQNKKPSCISELDNHHILIPTSYGRNVNLRFIHKQKIVSQKLTARLQSGNYVFLFHAVLQGLGIALMPIYLVHDELKKGNLIKVLDNYEPIGIGDYLYFLTMPNRYTSFATQEFMGFLADKIRKEIRKVK